MNAAIQEIDNEMEQASQALSAREYARCEHLCVSAMNRAHDLGEWATLQRILLPLQESRRLKRQTAIDGLVLLGTNEVADPLESLIADPRCGCIVMTWPYTPAQFEEVERLCQKGQRQVEVLYAENTTDAATWWITNTCSPQVRIEMPAPNVEWVGQWVDPLSTTPPTPAHWFMQAGEALGNAAFESITSKPGTKEYVEALIRAVDDMNHHEILHQRLADAARLLHEAQR